VQSREKLREREVENRCQRLAENYHSTYGFNNESYTATDTAGVSKGKKSQGASKAGHVLCWQKRRVVSRDGKRQIHGKQDPDASPEFTV
jgi:hypothetical protein